MPASKDSISQLIKNLAINLGFDACGITKATPLQKESFIFKEWLKNGNHASMTYMSRNVDKRLNPTLLNSWVSSVIMVLYNYYPHDKSLSEGKYKISKYAYGKDYHDVIKEKLQKIVDGVEDEVGKVIARVFVDSAPVLEKAWAVKCGLGWIGKNSCLINKKKGSFFFIGTIITNLELSYDKEELGEYCGSCTQCMDACPTAAIISPGIIDSRKCISYLTIEHKGELPAEQRDNLNDWIFGCDICQDVCPWNRFSKPHKEPAFNPYPQLSRMSNQDWEELDEKTFNMLFEGTAVERVGYEGLRRNIEQGIRNKE
ncbi:MAG: tRNA epoxyqueuosine(34) reductase QueG [Bacteroidales bacterium]|nr:tRNA epoxyqueuosine(34) reductase QueG [Bacteroidales bacterium]